MHVVFPIKKSSTIIHMQTSNNSVYLPFASVRLTCETKNIMHMTSYVHSALRMQIIDVDYSTTAPENLISQA